MTLTFNQALLKLSQFFSTHIPNLSQRLDLERSNDYDALFIKKLAKSNTLTNNNGNQKHIAFSNEKEINFFPYLDNFVEVIAEKRAGYISEEFKRRFGIKVEIRLLKENLEYQTNESSEDKTCFTTHFSSRGGNQSELGSISTDSAEFTDFRRMINEDDALIFLKHKGTFIYDLILVNKDDYSFIENDFKRSFVAYDSFSPTRQPSTLISPKDFQDDEQDRYLDFKIGGVNLIIYGAPGTGKSHTLKLRFKENVSRVTFHPEYTYYDFVGSLKPQSINQKVSYNFVPGPFALILKEAFKHKKQMHTLIIEELNRANTAAVFGDLFQLLDRDESGASEYGIQQNELLAFLNQELGDNLLEVKIPPNLNIVATMNSADQGVYPMDSAFKRRWEFEYLEISFKDVNEDISKKAIPYAGKFIEWSKMVKLINEALGGLEINEDKHIGPYFMKKYELDRIEAFTSKLLNYLWDDIARHKRKEIFEYESYNTFSKLNNGFIDGKRIFREDIIPLSSLDELVLDNQANTVAVINPTQRTDLGKDEQNE